MTQTLTGVERILKKMYGHVPRLLFVIAGPSGVGKNTIIKRLLANHPDVMARVVTNTTRPKRDDETEGEQYHFRTVEEFVEMGRANKLMEFDGEAGHDVYRSGNHYSMPADIYEDIPPEKFVVLAEVDIYGMRLLRERYPDCVTIFISASPEKLIERIFKRRDKHMDSHELAHRMETAREQVKAAREFDYILFNDDGSAEQVAAEIEKIIAVERMRVRAGADLETVIPEEAFPAMQQE